MSKGATRHQILTAGCGVFTPAPLPAVTSGAPGASSARSFSKVEMERVRILAQICRALDAHSAKGNPLQPQFRALARRWRGAVYRSAPTRRVALSRSTIARTYYSRWLHGGQNADGLKHRYGLNAPKFALTRQHRRRLARALQTASTLAELRTLVFKRCRKRPLMDAFRRCFTAEEWLGFSKAFTERRHASAAAARFAAWVKDWRRTFNGGAR